MQILGVRDRVRIRAALVDFVRRGQIQARVIDRGKDIDEYLVLMAVDLETESWPVPNHRRSRNGIHPVVHSDCTLYSVTQQTVSAVTPQSSLWRASR